MAYYTICPKCQAHLDPNEPCDCENEDNSKQAIYSKLIGINPKTGQLFFQKEKLKICKGGDFI